MKRKRKIIISAIVLFVLDLFLTLFNLYNYHYLVTEGNPLVYMDNGYLILIVNAFYFLVIVVLAIYIDSYNTVHIDSVGTFDYVKKLFHSDHYKFLFVSISFAFVYATLVSRLIVVIDWIVFGIYTNSFFQTLYSRLRDMMPLGRFDIVLGIIAFIIFLPIWYKFEYNKTKQMIKNLD